jgi:tetratricopeptide (TPR) repeat protein
MIKLKPIALAAIGCGLLQGCSMQPPTRQLAVQPVVRGDQPGNQAASWNRLARFHHERGQLALALGAYAQSLALDAGQLEARNAVAVIEAQQGNLESSRKALVALVNDFPGEAQPHTNLGYVLHLMGDHAGATRTLRRAMALGAGPKAFQNLQLAEAALGKTPADDAPRLADAQVPTSAPATMAAPVVMPAAAPATVDVQVATNAHGTVNASPVPATPRRSEPAPLAAAPLAASKPALEAGKIALPAPAEAQRTAPQQLTVLSTAAREIATHMELVKVAANVYELKDRVAAAPAIAPVAAAPKAGAPAVPQADKVRMARLEVANGNGVAGMARRFRSLLGQMGIPVDRLSNDKPYQQVATTIQYSPGFERQAASLQKALQGKARLASKPPSASDVRLVLGKDATLTLSAATEAAGLSLIAMHDDDSN